MMRGTRDDEWQESGLPSPGGKRVGMRVQGAVLLFFLVLPWSLDAQDAIETLFWQSVVCEKAGEVEAYLETYPGGAYVADARACLERQLGLDRAARVLVQQGLASLDYPPGPADGQFGPATRRALREWQTGKGFAATGYLARGQADTLIAQGREAAAAAQRQWEEAQRQAQEAATRAEAERRRQAQEAVARAEAERQAQEEERRRLARLPREVRNSLGMEFVLIEAGEFEMGSPFSEVGRDDDERPHQVQISQAFYLGKYEVTQEQWQAVMGSNPARFSNCGASCPVEQVSWEDVQGFIEELNVREWVGTYRLPTEAEWEYAARAGTQTAYSFGNAESDLALYGWSGALFFGRTHPVGRKRPNGWGLYDMHGNVWEWVADWYDDYPSGPVTDPRGPATGAARVYRGGSWNFSARVCRAAYRRSAALGRRYDYLGFRLARTP